jgi:hypothetical protein
LLRSAPGEGIEVEVGNWRAEPANTPIVEQAGETVLRMALMFER